MEPDDWLEWRRQTFWVVEAERNALLPRGWHWGEPWHERLSSSRRHRRGRWAVRNRDGRQVRVAESRWAFAFRIRKTALDLVMASEDLARSDPTRFAIVASELERDASLALQTAQSAMVRESVAADLEAFNHRARRLLDG